MPVSTGVNVRLPGGEALWVDSQIILDLLGWTLTRGRGADRVDLGGTEAGLVDSGAISSEPPVAADGGETAGLRGGSGSD